MDEEAECIRARLRKQIRKILGDCNDLIADAEYVTQRREDLGPVVTPDELVEVYLRRQWAHKALAALDAGEEIPPPPL
jgi:hypothetical protein